MKKTKKQRRKERLNKIAHGKFLIEGELLFSKETEPTLSNDRAFEHLYYLVRLAKSAQ